MPLQLYKKEKILDACLAVFARHGYEKTSTAMLAEAAGISKALIFHHFKSKHELYLSILDRCVKKVRAELRIRDLPDQPNFFEVNEAFIRIKVDYLRRNPDVYKVMMEAFHATPDELKVEIEEKYGELIMARDKSWKQLFEKVPLREGVDREEAYKLIRITLDYFEQKYLSEITDKSEWDEAIVRRFIDEISRFLDMIRYGIQR
ncbi:TetR/AcrR family transcriptional regulator [Desmospora profundinema]|uniref:AcrR family transcriptional regulator n=1 Tax=Desmospora profundinema TaxID=1571184 RepID=A0ABU1IHY7_9BACL|nr:TetR/AcrR family transcriptional regulator [Desmospora profundinema]MDR6224383.1 AcrR family transcriptional regulator [Desmospora profundinema]